MPRKRLDYQIEMIKKELSEMAQLTNNQLKDAIKALSKMDKDLAMKITERDSVVNELYTEVKERCVQTIALQQPVAKDLRFISISMDVATNYERIGDYAVDIARTVRYVLNEPEDVREAFKKELMTLMNTNGRDKNLIKEMGKNASKMIVLSGEMITKGKDEDIDKIMKLEEEMDKLFYEIFHKLIHSTRTDSGKIFYSLNLILTARHLERIGDHAVNIANRAVYARRGREEFI